ncbi:MAG: hypothetical protein QW472_00820 [Candidatus Aenigmatarchaeota archaeon]
MFKELEKWLYVSNISLILEDILKSIGLDKKRAIRKLDKVRVPNDYKKLIVDEFMDDTKKVEAVYNDIYEELIRLYKLYFSNLEILDEYSCYPKLTLYPGEMKILADLLKRHWYVNLLIYNAGLKEKSYVEEKLKDKLNYVIDFVPYFASFFSDIIEKVSSLEEALNMGDERGKILYWSLLGSETLFENLKIKLKDKCYERKNYPQIDDKLFKNHPFRILILDNIIEELWHISGVSMLDVGFYYKLMKMFDKRKVKDLLNHLEKKACNPKKLKYPIPRYFQNYDSCGVVCLLNAAKVYYPKLKLSKKLEKKLLSKVQYEGYPGNLAPLIVMVAKDVLNLETKMFFDSKTYTEKKEMMKYFAKKIGFDEEKILNVAEFFIDSAKKVGYMEKKEWEAEEIKELLKNGSMILFAKDFENILHYNLIFGYDEDKFYVFDPLCGDFSVHENKINDLMKNRFGMWGIITYPPYIETIKKMEENVEKCEEVLRYHEIKVS